MAITLIPEVKDALALVAAGQPSEAGRTLQLFADTQGDKALATTLKTVPSAELGQILVATATSPSIVIANLVKPDQFVKALVEVPKTWRPGQEDQATTDLQELFIGVVMQLDEEGRTKKAKSFLTAIGQDEEAVGLLAYYLMPYAWTIEIDDAGGEEVDAEAATVEKCAGVSKGHLHPAATQSSYEYHLGDWDHLLVILRRYHSHILDQMIKMWKDGMAFTDLLPRVMATATQADDESAL